MVGPPHNAAGEANCCAVITDDNIAHRRRIQEMKACPSGVDAAFERAASIRRRQSWRLAPVAQWPASSAGRPLADGRKPSPGGWNRIYFVVDNLTTEVARLWSAGVHFRNDVVMRPRGARIVLEDPSGNPIELFQPDAR